MPRPKSPTPPSYRHHKPSDQAVVTIDGKDVYLGKCDTEESREEYDRRIAEWLPAWSAGFQPAASRSRRDAGGPRRVHPRFTIQFTIRASVPPAR